MGVKQERLSKTEGRQGILRTKAKRRKQISEADSSSLSPGKAGPGDPGQGQRPVVDPDRCVWCVALDPSILCLLGLRQKSPWQSGTFPSSLRQNQLEPGFQPLGVLRNGSSWQCLSRVGGMGLSFSRPESGCPPLVTIFPGTTPSIILLGELLRQPWMEEGGEQTGLVRTLLPGGCRAPCGSEVSAGGATSSLHDLAVGPQVGEGRQTL